METVGDGKEFHPDGGGGLIRADVLDEAVGQEGKPAGGGAQVVNSGKDSVGPYDDTSLNARLLDKLNEQFEKQIQLVEHDQLDDGFKLNVYAEWVNSLRTLNTELVQSLREMQDTCMERLQLMRAAYLKDLARFGPDVRLKRLANTRDTSADDAGEQIVALELSSNYPIVPATDEMLLREVDTKASIIDEQSKELKDLRNMTQERDKQLDDKQQEIVILQHQIISLNDQLQKAKMSTTASIDNRSLISEITDHHDKITQLRKKLKEQEDKLREANTAIQYRDEVISAQRQEIKLLNESLENASMFSDLYEDGTMGSEESFPSSLSESFGREANRSSGDGKSILKLLFKSSEDDSSPIVEQNPGYPRSFLDRLGAIQQNSETESEYVKLLKCELADLREQLQHAHGRTPRVESEQALFRLRAACEELLRSTGRLPGCGDGWQEDCDESGTGSSPHFEGDDELIEAMRNRCHALCRQLTDKTNCTLEQDEGIGSASTSRLEHTDPIGQREQQQVMVCIEQQLKRLRKVLQESWYCYFWGPLAGCPQSRLHLITRRQIDGRALVTRVSSALAVNAS
uniref:Uncharacterized protein n=1 Tax=Anopheles maculatus TaxID=74869 RepID=A0A182T0Z9_9DIPT